MADAPARKPRPNFFPPDTTAAYDWFGRNGVDEYVPEGVAPVVVDEAAGTLTYTAFVWDGPRGWDSAHIALTPDRSEAATERRSVPLVEAPSPEVCEILAAQARRYRESCERALAGTLREAERLISTARRKLAAAQEAAESPVLTVRPVQGIAATGDLDAEARRLDALQGLASGRYSGSENPGPPTDPGQAQYADVFRSAGVEAERI